jgi:hypothetical protein
MTQNENIYKSDSNIKEDEGKSDFNKIEEKTVKNEVDKVGNSWGIGYLEYPIGDIINYIYKKTKINPTKMNKYVVKRNKNKINFDEETIFDQLKIDNLSDEELGKTDFIFLEALTRANEEAEEEEEEEETGNNNNENQEQNNNDNDNQVIKENEEDQKNNNKDSLNNNNKSNEPNSDKKNNAQNNDNNNKNEEQQNDNNNEENGETEESSALSEQQNLTLPYQYFESQYLMEFDQKFIYLKNIYQVEELDKNILPGFIIGKYMNKFHILGMNTSNIIEIKTNNEEENNENENNKNEENKNDEENNDKNEEQKEKEKIEEKDNNNQNIENKDDNDNKDNNVEGTNNNENQENNVEYIHQAIRFTKHLSTFINSKVQELNLQNARDFSFNERIFSLLDSNITSKEIFMNLLKDNCVGLYKFLNKLKNEKSLTNDDKLVLNITNDENLKFIQFCLMIIYNKLTSSILDSQKNKFHEFKNRILPRKFNFERNNSKPK